MSANGWFNFHNCTLYVGGAEFLMRHPSAVLQLSRDECWRSMCVFEVWCSRCGLALGNRLLSFAQLRWPPYRFALARKKANHRRTTLPHNPSIPWWCSGLFAELSSPCWSAPADPSLQRVFALALAQLYAPSVSLYCAFSRKEVVCFIDVKTINGREC